MAKTKVNKAAEIRAYYAANPTASGAEVVSALKKKGISVSPSQVYNAKATGNKSKKTKGKKGTKTRLTRPEDVQVISDRSLNVLEAALTMLEHVTLDSAKGLLDKLSRRKPR